MAGVHLHVRTCARADVPPFLYLRNGWRDCAEIWCVVKDQLERLFAKVIGGAQLHVRTCERADVPLFRISEKAEMIALTFGVWLETH